MKIEIPKDKDTVTTPKNIRDIFITILANESELDKEKEHFWVVGMTNSNKIKIIELVGIGTANQCHVYPKEVFRTLLHYACSNFILVHNHFGKSDPSQRDIEVTKNIEKGSEYIGVNLLDHIIIGENGQHTSFKEHEWIK